MPVKLPDLWPSEVDETAVLTPLAVLRHQAALLSGRSHNVLEAEVVSEPWSTNGDYVEHGLELVVPALDQFRVRLLTVRHEKTTVYPVWLGLGGHVGSMADQPAVSQLEFVERLGELLKSARVRSAIHSLLAQANDVATA